MTVTFRWQIQSDKPRFANADTGQHKRVWWPSGREVERRAGWLRKPDRPRIATLLDLADKNPGKDRFSI